MDRTKRNRGSEGIGTSSPSADTFIPQEWELENLRKQAHFLDETMTKLEPWILGMLQRNRVELPPELDHFLDRCEANRYLNFTVEEVVDQNWSAEEEKKDGMAKSKINRTRIVSSVDIDPYVHEPVRSSCSTHHRGVSGLPLRPSPPSAVVQLQPSGVKYQMKEILPRKAARTTSNVVANETRSESTRSKSAQTCPCAIRQYEEPQRSSSVHQPQYRKGSPILYEPEFVATIKRNKRKVEFDGIKIGMEERQKRKELMDAVLAHINKVVPKEQPQDIISTQ